MNQQNKLLNEFQFDFLFKDGTICDKHLKALFIGVLDEEVEMTFRSEEGEEELYEGALVGLRFNNSGLSLIHI